MSEMTIPKLSLKAKVALWYLVSIFGFAVIYWLMADQFYHAYLLKERSYAEAVQQVNDSVVAKINTKMPVEYEYETGFIRSFYSVEFGITGFGELDRRIEARIGLCDSKHDCQDLKVYLRADTYKDSLGQVKNSIEAQSCTPRTEACGNDHYLLALVLKQPSAGPRVGRMALSLFLPEDVNTKMWCLGPAQNGVQARAIPGSFWRMLYLSAVTITTVGYGDIVPLTTCARLTVAAEAILGIVLIGAFINQLQK
jgi:hypothetical protein